MTKASTTMNRRSVLKGAGMATVSAMFWYPSGKVLGANDRVNIAVIGIHGQGKSHINGFAKLPNVHLKTLCDIDENLFGARVSSVEKAHKYKPGTANDMARVFDDKDIDAVTFATPNHWHALGAIRAAQAGKHVYVEKPACHYVWEGRQMVNAARANKVLMQVGFQNRSRLNTSAAIKFIHDGKLGKIYRVRGLCYKPRLNIGKFPDGPMAEGAKLPPMVSNDAPYTAGYLDKVNYDQWMGPAPKRPFNPNRFHYNWHWQFEFGGGDTANQGPHQFDIGHWGLNREDHPVKIVSSGGLYLYGDSAQNTPNEQTSIMTYADGTVFEFATRGLPTNQDGDISIGNIFYGSEGRLEIDAGGNWKTYMGRKGEPGPDSKNIKAETSDALVTVGTGSGGHYGNFIEAVRAKKQSMLTCDIETGYRTSVLPALCNIAYRMGTELKWDGKREKFIGNNKANALLKRRDRRGYQVPRLRADS